MALEFSSAARRYAEAVFQLAQAEGREDQWDEELDLLAELFGYATTQSWLLNPSVPASEKEALIRRALASTSEEARNLARLLVSRGRPALAAAIHEAYQARLDDARGIVHAVVTTAVPLANGDLAAIEERLAGMTGRQVKMETSIDPSIIGGIVIRIGDKLIDGSTRARLLQLKRRLAGAVR
jgi:F-type H+-transporting ATPase subunit delta